MLLCLLRHAEAEDTAPSDSARRLTAKGEEQAERVGKFCRKHGIEPPVILTSPVTRALQTARLVAEAVRGAELIEVPWAACGMDPETARQELGAYASLPSVLLVGHQPDLGHLAATLLGASHVRSLHVRKALLAGIDVSRGLVAGRGELQFFIPVRMM